ncbi:MAG TPA: SDR family oxidoreductase, partial [Rhodothermales bacterium]|nr:SDR family oxidoreductase [Rhodothermales bacterium]
DLSGRVVLVTGASRGIGRAIAEGMAESGGTVAVHYRQNAVAAEEIAARLGRGTAAFQAELADPTACDRLFAAVLGVYGRLDVLVNNAAVSGHIRLDAPLEEWRRAWDRTIAVNLRAVDQLCRLAIGHFRQHGGGRIINVASRAAFRGDTPEYMAYAASKGGMVALTRSIARGFGTEGVCAFTLAPGFTRTDMAQEYMDAYGEAHALRDNALGRLTEPGDVAPLAVFLASGLADHATGSTIDINAASYVH